jgi:hypothetical protein
LRYAPGKAQLLPPYRKQRHDRHEGRYSYWQFDEGTEGLNDIRLLARRLVLDSTRFVVAQVAFRNYKWVETIKVGGTIYNRGT